MNTSRKSVALAGRFMIASSNTVSSESNFRMKSLYGSQCSGDVSIVLSMVYSIVSNVVVSIV